MSDLYTFWPLDCRIAMRLLMAPDSVDSIVTDPPYDLISIVKRFGGNNAAPVNNAETKAGRDNDPYARAARGFMGKQWDGTGVAFDPETWAEAYRVLKPGGHLLAFGGTRTYHRMVCAIEDAGFEIRDTICWHYATGFPKSHDVSKGIDKAAGAEREVVGTERHRDIRNGAGREYGEGILAAMREGPVQYLDHPITAPTTDEARQWSGWGTALKPATELICVARKPLAKGHTVAANVLAYGTGALNIDGCRVEAAVGDYAHAGNDLEHTRRGAADWRMPMQQAAPNALGRWPANLITDGSDEVKACFPLADASPVSAARFFYAAKASKADRGEGNTHPTVKPHELMRYLCRLVTPPGGLVLDPFTGSGSTGKAAIAEGFRFVGCEMTDEYIPIATKRIDGAVKARHDSRP